MHASNPENPAVLLISREETPLGTAAARLQEEGFSIHQFSEWQVPVWPPRQRPDLILLDAVDLKRDSLSLCAAIRQRYYGPLMVLAGTNEETFHILGLELGADDVMAKPVSPSLLTARIKSLLRRHHHPKESENTTIRHGDLTLNGGRREVYRGSSLVTLTTIEFDLLWYMASRAGSVVSRDEIHQALYASTYNGFNRAIDLYISQLRHKLGDSPAAPRYLKTVRGIGYLFAPTLQA